MMKIGANVKGAFRDRSAPSIAANERSIGSFSDSLRSVFISHVGVGRWLCPAFFSLHSAAGAKRLQEGATGRVTAWRALLLGKTCGDEFSARVSPQAADELDGHWRLLPAVARTQPAGKLRHIVIA